MASYTSKALQGESKERYLDKLPVTKLERCPYSIPGDCWSNDPTQWPETGVAGSVWIPVGIPGYFYERFYEKQEELRWA